jgi:ferredoxin
MDEKIKIHGRDREGNESVLLVEPGVNLRAVLLANSFSPYEGKFKKLNCKGMGVCGTCKILVREGGEDWERRSCQIQCFQELEIRLK